LQQKTSAMFVLWPARPRPPPTAGYFVAPIASGLDLLTQLTPLKEGAMACMTIPRQKVPGTVRLKFTLMQQTGGRNVWTKCLADPSMRKLRSRVPKQGDLVKHQGTAKKGHVGPDS
jgi:hypothetical protein